jgi:RecA/RadA recombinase
MAAKKKEDQEVEAGGSTSINTLSNFLKENKEDHFNFVEPVSQVISTGSLNLDSLIKIRSGSIIRLAGKGSELGKTSECLVISKNYMDLMPKSKTLFIKSEGRFGPEMRERSGHTIVSHPEDWTYGTTFIFSANIFETVAALIEDLLPKMYEAGEHLCIILDSLDGLILKNDYQKDIWGGDESVKVAGVPLLSKLMFKKLALKINHYDALFLITCQYSAAIKLSQYDSTPNRQVESSGGSAISHQNDISISYNTRSAGDYIYEYPNLKPDPIKNKCLGVYATVDIKKSSTDVTGARVKIPIARGRIGNAIWKEKEVVDMAIAFELLKGKGAWFNFSETLIAQALAEGVEIKEQHQGINGVYKYIEENKVVFEWLYKRFSDLVST